jgi:hypothetical protein
MFLLNPKIQEKFLKNKDTKIRKKKIFKSNISNFNNLVSVPPNQDSVVRDVYNSSNLTNNKLNVSGMS